jgi:hypothetical protein
MDAWQQLTVSMLQRKRDIDRDRASRNNMVSYDTWLVDAVELLLQIELQRNGRKPATKGE